MKRTYDVFKFKVDELEYHYVIIDLQWDRYGIITKNGIMEEGFIQPNKILVQYDEYSKKYAENGHEYLRMEKFLTK